MKQKAAVATPGFFFVYKMLNLRKLLAISGSANCSIRMDDKRCADPPCENSTITIKRRMNEQETKNTIVKLFVHHLRPVIRKQ